MTSADKSAYQTTVETSTYSNDLPVGAIIPTLASYTTDNIVKLARSGYYFCDGSLSFPTDNPELSRAIATSWGGVTAPGGAVAKFNLPPLSNSQQPYFLRGIDPTGHRDPEVNNRIPVAAGGNAGPNPGSFQNFATAAPTQGNQLTTASSGEHTHTCVGIGDFHRHYRGSNADDELEEADQVILSSNGSHTHLLGAGHGSGGNLTTAPKAVSVNWLIKQAT